MVYFVEDDNSIRELVIYTLNNAGYEAKGFERPSLFWQAMEKEKPRLILLDIMLPEEDGLQILKKVKSNNRFKRIPVMMLSAKGTEYDKVIGLDYGADDYVPKPFGIMELMARIKALLRRYEDDLLEEDKKEYILGDLKVSVPKHRVKVKDEEIQLTLKEFDMLVMFMENRGLVFTRDQILSRIWGYSFDGESRTVDVHIRTLRQKLKSSGDVIETVRGIGYKVGEAMYER